MTRLLTGLGIALLAAGIAAFAATALTEKNWTLISFACLMLSLLFFNLPTVLAKRHARREKQDEER